MTRFEYRTASGGGRGHSDSWPESAAAAKFSLQEKRHRECRKLVPQLHIGPWRGYFLDGRRGLSRSSKSFKGNTATFRNHVVLNQTWVRRRHDDF